MSGTKNAVFGETALPAACRLRAAQLNMPALTGYLNAAFPASTAKQVAHLAGVPASTVDKWLRGETRPSGEALCALVSVFGPCFLAAICPSCQWAQAVSHERDELQAYRTIFKTAQAQGQKRTIHA